MHISPDLLNASCNGRVKDSIILLSSDNESSDINDIDESSSNLQNQNAVKSVQTRAMWQNRQPYQPSWI